MTRMLLLSSLAAATLALTACATSEPAAAAPAGKAPAAAAATTDVIGGGSGVVAKVNGEAITFAELDQEAAAKLVRLKSQAYDIRKQTLDQLIDDRILAAEATKRGITKEELVKAEVTDKLGEISDADAKAYFDKNPPRGNVDFEQIKDRVKSFMQRQQEQELRTALIGGLRENAGVEVMLEPLRFDVSWDDDDPIYGKADAPVAIVEFSDFQCPYCSRVNPTLEKVKAEYGDKIALIFRDYPLPMHPEAPKAAEAASCANDQGKFWEMHDMLFENQRALKIADLKGYGAKLELDTAAFDKCLDDGKYGDDVKKDMADASAAGVTGTPAFFINGRFLNGARPYEQFKEAIDAELKAKGLL